ncbi:MAG: IS66 family transposase [Nitrospirae bacterium]|nr:IS66 family transposase [Nitrospirota bacterium]
MKVDFSTLPEDVSSLKEIIYSFEELRKENDSRYNLLQQYYTALDNNLTGLKERNALLEEELRLYRAMLYGRKSEKNNEAEKNQPGLFNEAEETVAVSSLEEKPQEITVPSHTRKKSGRRPLPDDLPREEVIHDLSEAEKLCPCGSQLGRIGEEVSEKLDIIPARVRVIKHVRYKYACKSCEGVESEGGAVKIAPLPPQIIPQGIATEGLLAFILISKFGDALPFYRQEKIFERLGVEIGRATMANWAIHAGQRCQPLIKLLWREICSGPVINMDETPVQVLNEPGRANTSKSYMWVFRGGEIKQPALLFRYDPSRSGKFLLKELADYSGYIQTDGYKGYNALGNRPGILHVGCWAHVRRKFVDAIKGRVKNGKKRGHADVVLEYIQQLYAIEKSADLQELSVPDRHQLRQEKVKPLLKEFREWLEEVAPKTPPQGLLGKAVGYALDLWERLERYAEDGRLRPDNNLAENAIRPFVVGRKNWLFSASPRGAEASATIYSLIETAKVNHLEPYRYLRHLFERLPAAKTKADYKALLPQYVDRNSINQMKF